MSGKNNHYDVIIIGAGIGGLVCGCYLAKAGMKVLIAEQHHKPGGYCTSFKRKGFTFDAAAHSFGSYREGGNMRRILKALDLDKRIKIDRHDPSDIIISPDYKITLWADINRTIEGLIEIFPHEAKGIKSFISFLSDSKPFDFAALRNMTFNDLLSQHLTDNKLKSMLSLPILGNGGLPPSLISAFTGTKIYTEFLLDGGYYPKGGMQVLPDIFSLRLKELGGELRLSNPVRKIKVESNEVKGVFLEKDGFISSKYVISNCDARQTFLKLLEQQVANGDFLSKLDRLIPSLSVFVVYLGIDKNYNLPNPGVNIWGMPHHKIEDLYLALQNGSTNNSTGYMVRVSPNRNSVQAFVNAPFKNKKYWINNKYILSEYLVKRIEQIIPQISQHIVLKEIATPDTMYRYTMNYQGAAYGWASMPSQMFSPELRQTTSINGLYLSGHWVAQTQGVSGVAYIGRETAKLILRKEKHKV